MASPEYLLDDASKIIVCQTGILRRIDIRLDQLRGEPLSAE
jgi:hypothetical protein